MTIPPSYMHDLWNAFLVCLGSFMVYVEFINLKNTFYAAGDGLSWRHIGNHGWLVIGLLLVAQGCGLPAIYIINGRSINLISHHDRPPLDLFPILVFLGVIRLAFLRFTEFAPNKNKFMAGNVSFDLIGEEGVVTKGVTSMQAGLVQMKNPVFKNEIIECIADEAINAGERVKVASVSCNMLRVIKVNVG